MTSEIEKKYIERLRHLFQSTDNDSEAFHSSYDRLLEEIIEEELGFKEFFEVLESEYEGYFWYA